MSRHGIPDELWLRLEPIVCPSRQERLGRPAKGTCLILNGILETAAQFFAVSEFRLFGLFRA